MPKTILGLTLFLFFALLGGWMFMSNGTTPVKTFTVEHGPIVATIAVTGKVVSRQDAVLSTAVSGTVTRLFIQEGDVVRAGKVLLRLDDREARAVLNKAEANLRRAREETTQMEHAVDRLQRLFAIGGEAAQAVEDARTQWQAAQSREQVAQEEVNLARLDRKRPAETALTLPD